LFGEEDPIGEKRQNQKAQSYRVIGLAKKRGAGDFSIWMMPFMFP